jgi:hypothetical protein
MYIKVTNINGVRVKQLKQDNEGTMMCWHKQEPCSSKCVAWEETQNEEKNERKIYCRASRAGKWGDPMLIGKMQIDAELK